MKKHLILICLFCYSINGIAQNTLTSKDSISTFYKSIISIMKSDYLYKEKVDWQQLESELKDSLANYNNFKNSLNQITTLFDGAGATHTSVLFEGNSISATYNGPSGNDFSEEWIRKYSAEPSFEVKIIDDNYGYILMPSMNFEDIGSKNIRKISQPLYDQITEVKESKELKGWIIDLRFNSGGNIWPMLLALYDFLGDNSVYGIMDIDKKIVAMTKLKNGKYYDNKKVTSYIVPSGKKLNEVKVAIIIGKATASSGEITALAFKGRSNTIFIGEPTMGMTTTNNKRNLPFGAFMALMIGYDCDRNGVFYEKILPEIELIKQDNFEDLTLDNNIIQAIKYIDGK
jgi:C-terminal processing protease CtpA/Prc